MIYQVGVKTASEEYIRFVICREMGWDFYIYESQPPFFLEQIFWFMKEENERENREMNKAERQMKTQSGGGYSRT